MSTNTNATVYVGVWNDWSRGLIKGSTLTVTSVTASIVIAILALFISQVGSHSWSIICFVTHQLRSTTKPRNGLYHQQQVILRNSVWGSDLGTIYQLAQVAYCWRGHGMRSIRATAWLLLLGFVHLSLFFITGTLSSRIVTVGNQVLLDGSNCGIWNFNSGGASDLDEQFEYALHGSKNAQSSWEYVQSCVSPGEPAPECNTFKKLSIAFNSTENAPCPFSPEMCNGPVNSSIRFDTGLIDSRDDLGINGRDEDRVQYRRVMTCSPITNQSLLLSGNTTVLGQTVNYTAAFYGANYEFPSSGIANGNVSNATYVHSDFKLLDFVYDELTESAYDFFTSTAWIGEPGEGFDAIPSLVNPDQGLTLGIVSFHGRYEQPSNDLWLAAHRGLPFVSAGDDNLSNDTIILRYPLDSPLVVMGCAEQHQYCNPNSDVDDIFNCTPLTARPNFNFIGTDTTTNPLYNAAFTTSNQFITLSVMNDAAGVSSIDTWLDRVDVPLLAADQNYISISTPLAENQWILETTNWFATGMNLLQRMVAETATGPPGKFSMYTAGNSSTVPGLDWFCKNVVVQNTSYVSFSMLALSLIFTFGLLVILISLWIESLAHSIQLKFQKGGNFQRRWHLDSTLQLHRMAFESAGLRSWKDGPREIPLTEKSELFGVGRSWDMSRNSLKNKFIEGLRPASPDSPGLVGHGKEKSARGLTELLLKIHSP